VDASSNKGENAINKMKVTAPSKDKMTKKGISEWIDAKLQEMDSEGEDVACYKTRTNKNLEDNQINNNNIKAVKNHNHIGNTNQKRMSTSPKKEDFRKDIDFTSSSPANGNKFSIGFTSTHNTHNVTNNAPNNVPNSGVNHPHNFSGQKTSTKFNLYKRNNEMSNSTTPNQNMNMEESDTGNGSYEEEEEEGDRSTIMYNNIDDQVRFLKFN
jgi:hypothetical protein